jgi:hypothetical protein
VGGVKESVNDLDLDPNHYVLLESNTKGSAIAEPLCDKRSLAPLVLGGCGLFVH